MKKNLIYLLLGAIALPATAMAGGLDGFVYHDLDGLADNSIYTNGGVNPNDKTSTSANLHAILYNSSNVVVASVPVNSTGVVGYYSFSGIAEGNYAVTINSYPGVIGNTIPADNITPGWESTGERIGQGAGTDGLVNGHSAFFNVTSTGFVMDVNFGVRVVPTPTEDCYFNHPYMPVDPGNYAIVNGITITPTARSGSVKEGTQGVFGCNNATTFLSYSLWGGYNRADLSDMNTPSNANTDWSITYTFSQPINNLRILVGSMGQYHNEDLVINVDGVPATINDEQSCFLTVTGNQIYGGYNPSLNGAGNGMFTVSKATPFTTLTFSGLGGSNGLNIEFCSSSIVPAPLGVSISGNVFIDADGLTNNNINTSGSTPNEGTNAGGLYANLINGSGTVIGTVPVASNGTYNFSNVAPGDYSVVISTLSSPSTTPSLPSGWVNTGDFVGTGSGNDLTPDGDLEFTVGSTNLDNINFGIQRPPESENREQTIPQPTGGTISAGTATRDVLGDDPEDGSLGNANTIVIKSLPTNSTMYYDNDPVLVGQVITGFDPSLLSFTGLPLGSTETIFTYSFRDAAGFDDPTPATYELKWPTPLSITLINFEGIYKNNLVTLNWNTSNENNNRGFSIEKSNDGTKWKEIGFVKSQSENGNSSAKLNYQFMDSEINFGLNYYRLKQLDIDGVFEYSDVVKINILNNNKIYAIHPNPASEFLIVDKLNGNETITIVDVLGKIVLTENTQRSIIKINISTLSSGFYNCIISSENGKEVHKILVN